jgi:cell division protein ZapA (FtsZ GTPase activity inhibitor)
MTVEIKIGKKLYNLACADDEKEKILKLAERLNQRLQELAKSLKIADEKMLLVMAALTLEEELNSITEEKFSAEEMFNSISDNIDNITSYIEKLTTKIQKL